MQILINAGFPFIGKDYMGTWKDSIGEANSEGFFESKLRTGINYKTNPNPGSGTYLHPNTSTKYAVKVFVPGLVKTDFAFIHRVVATVRRWDEYCVSFERLMAMEAEYLSRLPEKPGEPPPRAMAIISRPNVHPALMWWKDNFNLVSDTLTRLYPIRVVTYGRLIEAPGDVLPPVLQWCDSVLPTDLFEHEPVPGLNIEKAVECVNPDLRTQVQPVVDNHGLPEEAIRAFDDLYECFHTQNASLSRRFRDHLNHVHGLLEPIHAQQVKVGLRQKSEELLALGLSKHKVQAILFRQSSGTRN
jgi:hypothetical protein